MAENTNIEWCDHTFNPWTGCTKVSPGCANCYAEGWSKRSGIVTWGKGQPRRRTSAAIWKQPLKWNTAGNVCFECGTHVHGDRCMAGQCRGVTRRPRVFCASLGDWLDDEVPVEWLADLLSLIHRTPHLDWLLLSKRPQNWRERLIAARGVMFADPLDVADRIDRWIDGNPWHNVWIGTTVEDQQRADERIPHLLDIPAKVRFLSCEPLLGFTDIQQVGDDNLTIYWPLVGRAISDGMNEPAALKHGGIHWVICGGESGPKARPMHPKWVRAIRDQCQAAGVPFLFKQWGEYLPVTPLYDDHDEDAEDGCNPDRLEVFYTDGKKWDFAWGQPFIEDEPWIIEHVGKKAAGRQLDGREWNEFPTF
jgi:protein gp37